MDSKEWKPEEHERNLYEYWRTSDNFNINSSNCLQNFNAGDFHECKNNPQKRPKKQESNEIIIVILAPDIKMSLYLTAVSITKSIIMSSPIYLHAATV